MEHKKPKRIVDRLLIKTIQQSECVVCDYSPVDAHHLTTRGAGGHDTVDNLIPVCRQHHQEAHKIGNRAMAEKYRDFKLWLKQHERFDILRDPLEKLH